MENLGKSDRNVISNKTALTTVKSSTSILAELKSRIDELRIDPAVTSLCVAFSGGVDSTVLLHALAQACPEEPGIPLRAIHVNHQMHAQAEHWAEHCRAVCTGLQISLDVHAVAVELNSGIGPEAAARQARYDLLREQVRPGEVLVTAHHRQDQLETLLLQLLRGAGVAGLAAMPVRAAFGSGWLLRPLLDISGAEIGAYADELDLDWLDDPSNRDTNLDRNYLRHEVLPRLEARWPAAAATVARSARHCAEAASIMEAVARQDAAAALVGNRLRVLALQELPRPRQNNLIRYTLRRLGYPYPTGRQIGTVIGGLLEARGDSQPQVCWPGVQVRRYRDQIYFLPDHDFDNADVRSAYAWNPATELDLGPVRGCLQVEETTEQGLAQQFLEKSLTVKFRGGGERIRPAGERHSRTLKNLFQEAGVVPWMRGHVPLVYAGERLVAVGDLWIDAQASTRHGERAYRLDWRGHQDLR
ncbi:MAG: tRNA lysidine(34) synthetase TilS [Gammaproteobacteria bacterium]